MTISSQSRSAGPFVGNNVQTVFPFAFKVFEAADLVVTLVDTDLNSTNQTLSVDYTVVLNPDQNVAPGGYVQMLAPLATGIELGIKSDIEAVQPLRLTNAGGFFPQNIEDSLDRLTILVQQLNLNQSIRVPEVGGAPFLPAAGVRAGHLLGFDSLGRPTAVLPNGGTSTDLALQLASAATSSYGAGQIGFNPALSYPTRTVGSALGGRIYAGFYDTVTEAVAAAQGRILVFSPGAYSIASSLDCGTATLQFDAGAVLTVPNGSVLTTHKPIDAGSYQIFAQTGVVISAGSRNPMWWGAVASRTSPGAVVARSNTIAFRKAAMSLYSEYVLNAGTLAAPGPCIPYTVDIPAGLYYLSNGFAAPVGVPVRGDGAATCLCRLGANVDTDTAIPLLTVGQSLDVAPTLAYKNDPGTSQSTSTFAAAGFGQTSAAASDLYFVDQDPSAGAFAPRYPGCQFHSLFFTSCGLALNLNNSGDLTGTNIVIDMGLTGIAIANAQNIRLTNTILYYTVSQAVSVGTNIFDATLDLHIEYPQGIAINMGGAGTIHGLKFPNLSITQNGSVGTNAVIVNASDIDVEFSNASFRNLGNCAAIEVNSGLANVSVRVKGATFDGRRTNPVYNQNGNMQAFSIGSGKVVIEDAVMRNLGVRSVVTGTADVTVRGLQWDSMSSAAGLFDVTNTTGGKVTFSGVNGDGVTPLFYTSGGLARLRVEDSTEWLGTPAAYAGSYVAWDLTLPAYGQLLVTVSGQTDSTANLRKSATYIFEKSVELLPALTDTITSSKLHASATANGHPELVPSIVFVSSGTTAQLGTGTTPATGKLRVPNTYSSLTANVEYLN